MDKIDNLNRNMGTWGFLRTGWWIVHVVGILLIFWLGMWFGTVY